MLIQPRSNEDHKNIVEQGFTLVELLIVIVIMGILAGIVVFAVGNLTGSAANNACSVEGDTFATAYQAYKTQATAAQWSLFSVDTDTVTAGIQAPTTQYQATYLRDTVSPSLLTFSGTTLKYLSNVAGQGGAATAAPMWSSNVGTGVVTKTC